MSGEPRLLPLRICLVDMNNGHVNQAMRCLRGIVSTFFDRVRRHNPGLECVLGEASPRDTQNPVPRDYDLYISTGGPGSPYDGDGMPWVTDYSGFLDHVVESSIRGGEAGKVVCEAVVGSRARLREVPDPRRRVGRKTVCQVPMCVAPLGWRRDPEYGGAHQWMPESQPLLVRDQHAALACLIQRRNRLGTGVLETRRDCRNTA